MNDKHFICPICGCKTNDYFCMSGTIITDIKCTNRRCFFSSNYVPRNTWDRLMHMVESVSDLQSELTRIKALTPEQFEAEFKGENK